MKKLLFISLLLVFVNLSTNAQKKKGKEEVVFDVSMTCENCKKRIEKNIAFEKGVADMKVDLAAKTVKLVYKNDKTDVEKLKQAIEKLGYTVSLHKETENE